MKKVLVYQIVYKYSKRKVVGKKSFLKPVIKCKNSLCEWWLTNSLGVCVCTSKYDFVRTNYITSDCGLFEVKTICLALINKLWSKQGSREAEYESGLGKGEGMGLGYGMEYEFKSAWSLHIHQKIWLDIFATLVYVWLYVLQYGSFFFGGYIVEDVKLLQLNILTVGRLW